jgi:hypothetical protein
MINYSVYAPMISPPHNPTRVHTKASVGALTFPSLVSPINSSGREMEAATYKIGVKIKVEIINCHFKVFSIFSF